MIKFNLPPLINDLFKLRFGLSNLLEYIEDGDLEYYCLCILNTDVNHTDRTVVLVDTFLINNFPTTILNIIIGNFKYLNYIDVNIFYPSTAYKPRVKYLNYVIKQIDKILSKDKYVIYFNKLEKYKDGTYYMSDLENASVYDYKEILEVTEGLDEDYYTVKIHY